MEVYQQFPDGVPRKVFISGPPEAVEIAVCMVEDVSGVDRVRLIMDGSEQQSIRRVLSRGRHHGLLARSRSVRHFSVLPTGPCLGCVTLAFG